MERIADGTWTEVQVEQAASPSRSAGRAGRILSGLVILLLALDGVAKVLLLPQVVQGSAELGFPAGTVRPIGVLLLLCVAAYAAPATSALGALLLTGYLGGAVATHVRMGHPLASHVLTPVYVAVLAWAGLWLRRPGLRAYLPLWRRA